MSLNVAVADNKVLDSSINKTKDGLIFATCVTDVDAANGVALAVESAMEPMSSSSFSSSYGRKVVLLRLVVGDVGTQLKEFAFIVRAAVDLAGQQVEALGSGDDVCFVGC